MNRADRRIAVGLFLLTFVSYAWFAGGGGWNQNAQFALTRAIVERQTFAIDAYADTTGDLSYHAGHTYANKAPGVSLLAVVPYAMIVAVERGFGVDPASATIFNLWLVTVFTCALSGAAIPPLLFLYGRQRMRTSRSAALMVAVIFAFATYLFAYSTVFFAHVPSAFFLLAAFTYRGKRPGLAGAVAGLAGLCNYLCIPAALIILFSRRDGITRMIAGAAPPAVLLALYQFTAFGAPWKTSIDTMDPRFATPGAVMGAIVPPQWSVLPAITVSPYRGLFYLSPVLLMAFAGAVVMWRGRTMRRELVVCLSIFAFFVAFNMCFNGWHGGSAIGPRYLLSAVPLLAIPMFFAAGILRPLWIALGIVSFAFNFVATAVNPLPSKVIADPIGKYLIPLFVTGHLPASTPPQPVWGWKVMLGHVGVNRNAPDEAYPYTRHRPGSREAEWASFNVGELAFPNSPWSTAPLLLWIVGGTALLARRAAEEDQSSQLP